MTEKMTIEKVVDFYLNNRRLVTPRNEFVPTAISGVVGDWDSYDERIHSEFSAQYKIQLSQDQRWFVFLKFVSTLDITIDKALAIYFENQSNKIAHWSVRRAGDFNYGDSVLDLERKFENFPFSVNSLFLYSLEHFETIYPGLPRAKELVEALGKYSIANTPPSAKDALTKLYALSTI